MTEEQKVKQLLATLIYLDEQLGKVAETLFKLGSVSPEYQDQVTEKLTKLTQLRKQIKIARLKLNFYFLK